MTIQISEFTNKHLSFVARLLNAEYRETHEFIPFNEERIWSQIRRRDLKILVAEENGIVLGLIGTHPEEHGEKTSGGSLLTKVTIGQSLKTCS